MDITPTIHAGKKIITGYGDGGFKINGEFISGSLLLYGEHCLKWDIKTADEITAQSLEPIIFLQGIELLLIGTGKQTSHVDSAIKILLKSKNIALDVMDTGAAARTYNVLSSEDRRVGVAVISI